MCYTDGITSHLFQDLHLTVDRTVVSCCSERPLIVMHTYTLQLHILSVQREACITVKIEITESVFCIISIRYLSIYQYFCTDGIQVRIIYTPEFRIGNRYGSPYLCCLTCCNTLCIGCYCTDTLICTSIFWKYCMSDSYTLCSIRIICNRCSYIGIHCTAFFGFKIGSCNLCTVQIYMYIICNRQIYISVDTTS